MPDRLTVAGIGVVAYNTAENGRSGRPAPNNQIEVNWWSAPASSFAAIFAAQPRCAAAYPNLKADFIATVQRLDASPVVVETTDQAG